VLFVVRCLCVVCNKKNVSSSPNKIQDPETQSHFKRLLCSVRTYSTYVRTVLTVQYYVTIAPCNKTQDPETQSHFERLDCVPSVHTATCGNIVEIGDSDTPRCAGQSIERLACSQSSKISPARLNAHPRKKFY
jgi:hypothetical protein